MLAGIGVGVTVVVAMGAIVWVALNSGDDARDPVERTESADPSPDSASPDSASLQGAGPGDASVSREDPPAQFAGHGATLRDLVVLDGNRVVSAGDDGTVQAWDPADLA